MALIKCPECGKEISSHAEKCIHCGYPLNSKIETKSTWDLLDEIHDYYENVGKPKFTFENMRLPTDWQLW